MAERAAVAIALVTIAYAAYWVLVPPRFRALALFLGSFLFLAAQDLVHAPFLLVLTFGAWLSVRKKRGRVVVIVLTLLCLILYRALGPTMDIFAFAGFSYAAFKLVSYVAESLRDNLEVEPPLTHALAYVFFLPTFFAGPIARISTFAVKPEHEANDFIQGVKRVLWGLLKKVAVVPWLEAHLAGAPLAVLDQNDRLRLLGAVFFLAIRIYVDFSAYSDIAIGFGRLFGVPVPENFHWPYFHSNIVQFWQNWHITLSEWIRDYLFMPISRWLLSTPLKRNATACAALAYLIAFTLCGAWHGFSPHFLVWGAYHGALLGAHRLYNDRFSRRRDHAIHRWRKNPLFQLGGCVITFGLVTVGWLFFRYEVGEVARILARLASLALVPFGR